MGTLYIVPTPVGNLQDITLRALTVLKEVDLILAEDTRQSGKLLKHFEIEKQLIAYHKFNEHKSVQGLIERLSGGVNMALVSDGGTPGISDPGHILIAACVEAGIPVQTLPGATAFVPALVNSGFNTDEFVFLGFLPHKKGRQTALKKIAEEERTVILYESPYRVVKLLGEAKEHVGADRLISMSREISKMFEETVRGTPDELLEHFKKKEPRGEFVVIFNSKQKKRKAEKEED